MKKLFVVLLVFMFVLSSVSAVAMEISAKSAILIDADTGRVIYSKNSREKMGMASTTKIMTALVALDNYNPTDVVTASYNAATTEGSSVYLKPGEKMSLEHILYGLMLASGNDAAVAIAEHIGGNQYTFVEYMNNKVINLGLKDTHFENYLDTLEGKNLPVEHCIKGTKGHDIPDSILRGHDVIFEKLTFGSIELIEYLKGIEFDEIELIGLCTDICVISNALLVKAHFYNKIVKVDSSCSAGVSVKSHNEALNTMKMCQIQVI